MAMITQYSNLLNNTIEVPDDVDPLALQQAEQDMFMQQQQQQQAMQQGGQGIGGGQGGGALGFLGNLVNTATDYASAPGMFYAPSVAGAYAMTPEGFNQHMTRMQGTLNQQNAQRAQAQESAADRQQRSQIAQAQNRMKMQQMLQDQEDQKNELKFREQSLDIQRRQVDLQENTQAFYQKMKEREEAKPTIMDGMQLDWNETTGQYSARPIQGLPVDMEYFDKNTGQYIVNGPNGPEWRTVPGSPDIGGGYVGTGGSGVVGTAGGGGPRGRSSGGRSGGGKSGGGSSGGASVDAKGTVTINGKKYKPQDRYHTWFVDEEGNTLTRDQITGLIEAEESQSSDTNLLAGAQQQWDKDWASFSEARMKSGDYSPDETYSDFLKWKGPRPATITPMPAVIPRESSASNTIPPGTHVMKGPDGKVQQVPPGTPGAFVVQDDGSVLPAQSAEPPVVPPAAPPAPPPSIALPPPSFLILPETQQKINTTVTLKPNEEEGLTWDEIVRRQRGLK